MEIGKSKAVKEYGTQCESITRTCKERIGQRMRKQEYRDAKNREVRDKKDYTGK